MLCTDLELDVFSFNCPFCFGRIRAFTNFVMFFFAGIKNSGLELQNKDQFFDTIKVQCNGHRADILQRAEEKEINFRHHDDGCVSTLCIRKGYQEV